MILQLIWHDCKGCRWCLLVLVLVLIVAILAFERYIQSRNIHNKTKYTTHKYNINIDTLLNLAKLNVPRASCNTLQRHC